MNHRFQELQKQLLYLPRILTLVWAASKRYTIVWAALLIMQGLLPAAIVFLSRLLVDSLVGAIGGDASWESVRPVVLFAGLMAGILLLTEVLGSIMEWIRTAQSELVQDHINALVHEKSVSLDIGFYESPDFHDRLDRARSEANERSLALLESGGGLLQNGITLIAMASMLIPYGFWVPAVLLLSTIPAFYIVIGFSKRYHRWWERSTPDRRWAKYYDWMLTFSAFAPELRMFGLGDSFRSSYKRLRKGLRTDQISLIKRQSMARFGAGVLALFIGGGAMAWMVWRAFMGSVSLGDLVLFYQAFNRGQTLMRSLLNNIGQIYSNSLFIGNLFDFLELEPEVTSPENPVPMPFELKQGITFNNVTFGYSGATEPALRDFSLAIPAGKTIAIVGANGAGKTTLLKLLCRFYDPVSGHVEIDGIDMRDLSIEELRRRISVVFQSPVPYHATASQNIVLGNLDSPPSREEVETAARSAGAHEFISRLPNGYDTMLGKWFANGSELSGGEWQRLALARSFVRQAPIIILDEPTSFMDSWSEIEWMERFQELAVGRTAVIITHRFTTAMRADIIHVMDQGQVVESGSHEQLLALDGLYAKSWVAQMSVEPDIMEVASSASFAQVG